MSAGIGIGRHRQPPVPAISESPETRDPRARIPNPQSLTPRQGANSVTVGEAQRWFSAAAMTDGYEAAYRRVLLDIATDAVPWMVGTPLGWP